MTGSCIIDGTDLATLGIFIERGGSDDFLSFPDRRTPDFNDWAEYDGLDVDLSDLSFDAKKVTVNYVLTAADESAFKSRLNAFETLHFAAGYRSVFVREFNKTFQLRFTGFADYSHKGGFYKNGKKTGKIAAEYVMDDPLQLYTTAVDIPITTRATLSHVQLNGIDLSRFGIVVRDIYSTVLRPRSAKSVLERKINIISGTTADVDVSPKKQPREIIIKCAMLAETLSELLTNLSALWANVNITTAVKLHAAGEGLNCYYTKMASFKKETAFNRKVKVSFDLHLQEFSEIQLARLLAAENNYLITTEDGLCIDLK